MYRKDLKKSARECWAKGYMGWQEYRDGLMDAAVKLKFKSRAGDIDLQETWNLFFQDCSRSRRGR